jgi:hypothetical protein
MMHNEMSKTKMKLKKNSKLKFVFTFGQFPSIIAYCSLLNNDDGELVCINDVVEVIGYIYEPIDVISS